MQDYGISGNIGVHGDFWCSASGAVLVLLFGQSENTKMTCHFKFLCGISCFIADLFRNVLSTVNLKIGIGRRFVWNYKYRHIPVSYPLSQIFSSKIEPLSYTVGRMSFLFGYQVYSQLSLCFSELCIETSNWVLRHFLRFKALTLPRPHSVNMLPNQEGWKKHELSKSKAHICSKVLGNHIFLLLSVKSHWTEWTQILFTSLALCL